MKAHHQLWLGACLMLGSSALLTLSAQNTNTNALPPMPLPIPTATAMEMDEAQEAMRAPLPKPPPLEPPPPIPLDPPRYGGLIGDALLMDQPLQLINPLAPASYGDGTRNLSVHPTSGRVEGVTLFSIKLFKSPQNAKKPKKPKRGRAAE